MLPHQSSGEGKAEITTESLLLQWLVRHCGRILSRYGARSEGRKGYSRLTGREYTAVIAIFGEAIWYELPKTADLTKLDDRCCTAIWLGSLEIGAVFARSVRRKEGRGQALERRSAEDGHGHTLESSAK